MPRDLRRPVRFVVGGDVGTSGKAVLVSRQAADVDPLFAVLGGDLAYDGGHDLVAFVNFVKLWRRHMVAEGRRMIPLLAAIGNHEVQGGHSRHPRDAPLFHALFGVYEDGPAHTVFDFGDYLSLILLDSGHTAPVGGRQARWLERALSRRADVPHRIAVYHVPAWPSHRALDDEPSSIAVRGSWLPLFEHYGLPLAFEHHDHTYKRTVPIRGQQPHPDGVVYIGDGGWGRSIRQPLPAHEVWYLERTAKRFHFVEVTLDARRRLVRAIDVAGKVFDEYEQLVTGPAPANTGRPAR